MLMQNSHKPKFLYLFECILLAVQLEKYISYGYTPLLDTGSYSGPFAAL